MLAHSLPGDSFTAHSIAKIAPEKCTLTRVDALRCESLLLHQELILILPHRLLVDRIRELLHREFNCWFQGCGYSHFFLFLKNGKSQTGNFYPNRSIHPLLVVIFRGSKPLPDGKTTIEGNSDSLLVSILRRLLFLRSHSFPLELKHQACGSPLWDQFHSHTL